jgi:hypothetical protein
LYDSHRISYQFTIGHIHDLSGVYEVFILKPQNVIRYFLYRLHLAPYYFMIVPSVGKQSFQYPD